MTTLHPNPNITHHWPGVTAKAHPNLWLPGRNKVVIDRIIPWMLQVQDIHSISCALTCLDFFTNLTELLISIESKGSLQVTACWFSHYPRPNYCVHDNGGEFVGYQFSSNYWRIIISGIFQPLQRIPNKPMQSVSWCLRLWPRYFNQRYRIISRLFIWLIQLWPRQSCTSYIPMNHHTISPGGLVVQCDMLLDIPTISDLTTIHEHLQLRINDNLCVQIINVLFTLINWVVRFYCYYCPHKLGPYTSGPYQVNK